MDNGRKDDVNVDAETIAPELVGEDMTADDDATQWEAWDAAFEREEGPFDIKEVDLEADEVKRLDLGTLILTPFDKMNLQLQVDKSKDKVQALLISDGGGRLCRPHPIVDAAGDPGRDHQGHHGGRRQDRTGPGPLRR